MESSMQFNWKELREGIRKKARFLSVFSNLRTIDYILSKLNLESDEELTNKYETDAKFRQWVLDVKKEFHLE